MKLVQYESSWVYAYSPLFLSKEPIKLGLMLQNFYTVPPHLLKVYVSSNKGYGIYALVWTISTKYTVFLCNHLKPFTNDSLTAIEATFSTQTTPPT